MWKLTFLGVLVAGIAFAAPRAIIIPVTVGANTSGSTTQEKLTGEVDTIHVSVVGGSVTGTVAVTYTPSHMSAVNLATNAVVSAKTWRPRVDATDVTGAALTSDPPVAYVLFGDDVTVSITNAPASSVWNAVIVLK